MKEFTIYLSDERLGTLRSLAEAHGIRADEMLQLCVDDLLDRRQEFERAATYVLTTRAELYRRLAQS